MKTKDFKKFLCSVSLFLHNEINDHLKILVLTPRNQYHRKNVIASRNLSMKKLNIYVNYTSKCFLDLVIIGISVL